MNRRWVFVVVVELPTNLWYQPFSTLFRWVSCLWRVPHRTVRTSKTETKVLCGSCSISVNLFFPEIWEGWLVFPYGRRWVGVASRPDEFLFVEGNGQQPCVWYTSIIIVKNKRYRNTRASCNCSLRPLAFCSLCSLCFEQGNTYATHPIRGCDVEVVLGKQQLTQSPNLFVCLHPTDPTRFVRSYWVFPCARWEEQRALVR